jgi:hypothetical protein
MIKILTARERLILYLTLGFALFSLGFNYLALPLLDKNYSLNKEIAAAESKLTKYLRLLGRQDGIRDKYAKLSLDFKLTGRKPDALFAVLSELENIAKESNIRIIDLRPQVPNNSSLYKGVFVELKTEGVAQDYLKFIYNIENSLFLLEIKRFQLAAKQAQQVLEGSFSILEISLPE